MKRSIRVIIAVILSVMLIGAAFAFVACSGSSDIVELRIEKAKISFMCGDEFETGENFTVYADYKDGTSENVTDRVSVRQESGMDMNVAGDYQITVMFGEKRAIYTVYVNDAEDVLRKIELDSSAVKKQYKLGDAVSLDGLVLDLTYENAQGIIFNESETSLKNFNVAITSENGGVITDMFTTLGKFTVTVSKGNVKASFDINVNDVNISTVGSALTVAGFYGNKVVSGNAHIQGARLHYGEDFGLESGEPFTAYRYEYLFGKNYTYFKDTHANPIEEYHCSMEDDGLFVAYLEGGTVRESNLKNIDMMNGAPFLLWYNSDMVFGVENTLNNLYSHAKAATNKDLKETANESERKYSFSFSGLEMRDSNSDYYETTVSFTLGTDYAITTFTCTQDYYENNSSLSQQPGYVPTFTTDASGKTTPGAEYSYRTIITVTQVTGERTAENSYGSDMFKVKSYKLMYNGRELENEATIECDAGQTYTLQLTDIMPATANLEVDRIIFDYEGNFGSGTPILLSNENFTLTSDGAVITLTTRLGGSWTLLFKTENTSFKLNIDVTGVAPTEMTAKIFNENSSAFYDGNVKTVNVGQKIYFFGEVKGYANSAQKVTVTSDNGEYAKIEAALVKVKVGINDKVGTDTECWVFTASRPGTYRLKAEANNYPIANCEFTFTVNKTVDYEELLTGTYTVNDKVKYTYRITFTLDESEPLHGIVLVVRTDVDTGEAVQKTLTFRVEDLIIIVDNNIENVLWADFEVNEDGELMFINEAGRQFPMQREN